MAALLQPFWQNYHAEVLAVRSNLLESEEETSKDWSRAPAALHLSNSFQEEWNDFRNVAVLICSIAFASELVFVALS